MSAPLFFVAPGVLGGPSTVVLDGPEGWHAARVRRIRVGERVDLADGSGLLAHCEVVVADKDSLTLDVLTCAEVPVPAPSLTVVQALPKGDRGELAVEMLTEVGVDAIVPWAAARCVTRWASERGAKAHARWAAHAREAAKQARRARVPEVAPLADTAQVARRVAGSALPVVLHEGADGPLTALDVPADGEILLVVGPEGGVTEEELGLLTTAGAQAARLGPEVLRTSTAGLAASAALLARTSRWA